MRTSTGHKIETKISTQRGLARSAVSRFGFLSRKDDSPVLFGHPAWANTISRRLSKLDYISNKVLVQANCLKNTRKNCVY